MSSNESNPKWALKEGIKFHLYISEVPCGDASMGIQNPAQDVHEDQKNKRETKLDEKSGHWTGAKTVEGTASFERGLARIKSGRSDMNDE